MELTNLAASLSEEELKTIAELVYDEYKQDNESRSEWLEKHAKWLELYYQTDDSSIEEWQSNESIPVLTEACNLFQARAYKAFFPARQFIQAVIEGTQPTQEATAAGERVAKHLNYQLSIEDRSYKPDKNAMFLAVALHGSDFTKTYRDPIKNRNVVERVRATDLVMPYGTGPRRMQDIERKTHVIYKSINDTKILAASGYFTKPGVPMEEVAEQNNTVREVEDKAQGIEKPTTQEYIDISCLLEQHRLLDLDHDGIAEPYVVTIDRTTKDVLRICIRYEVDETGEATNNKEPIEYFTQYNFLTNPHGTYGLGYGHFIGKLNQAINKMLRQIADAGTLANAGNMSGFVSEQLGVKGDDNFLAIGKLKKLPRTVDDIRKGLYLMQFPGANQSLVNTLEMLISTAQRVSSTTDAVTGDVDKVLQPMTIMTMLESSLQLPTSVMEQLALSFEEELDKLYKLNQKYFDTPQMVVTGDVVEEVHPQDYQQQMRIVPIIDPRQITQQQKVAKGQQLFQFAMENPVLQNPQSLTEITKRNLEAMEIEDIDKILPQPPQPQQIDDQKTENFFYLLPPEERPAFDVFPDQDHATHLKLVDQLLALLEPSLDPSIEPQNQIFDPATVMLIQQLSDMDKQEIVTSLMQHRRKHVAYLYGGMINGQGQAGTMAQAGSNAMGTQGASLALPPAANMDMQPGNGGTPPGAMGSPAGALPGNGLGTPIGALGLATMNMPKLG